MSVSGVGGDSPQSQGSASASQLSSCSSGVQQTGSASSSSSVDQTGLKLQLALLALQMGNVMALQPAQQQVANQSNLIQTLTNQTTNLNTMSALITFLTGSTQSGGIPSSDETEFNTDLNNFVSAFNNTYLTNQPNAPKLSSIDITMQIKNPNFNANTWNPKDPSTGPYINAQVQASALTAYFQKWAQAAGQYGNQMFATSGSEGVSGLQQVMLNTIQTQLDTQLSTPSGQITFPTGQSFNKASANAYATSQLQSLLNSTGSNNPLPVTTSSTDPQISELFNVLTDLPNGTYTLNTNNNPWNPPDNPANYNPLGSQGEPTTSIEAALFGNNANTFTSLSQSFQWSAWVAENQTESASPTNAQQWVAAHEVTSGLSEYSTTLNNGIQALSSTSTQLGQTMRSILSNVSVIQNVISEIIKTATQAIATSIQGQKTQ